MTTTGEVAQAVASLAVDAIYVPTDNNVVSGLAERRGLRRAEEIPLITGEGDSVKNGGLITYGLDYSKLGYQTGEMAVKILRDGAKPATMPVESQKDPSLLRELQGCGAHGRHDPPQGHPGQGDRRRRMIAALDLGLIFGIMALAST